MPMSGLAVEPKQFGRANNSLAINELDLDTDFSRFGVGIHCLDGGNRLLSSAKFESRRERNLNHATSYPVYR